MTAQETGFEIDGKVYPIPNLGSLNMDEAQVLYDYSGLTIEDFAQAGTDPSDDELDGLTEKLRNPGFLRALLHVAYARGNTGLKPAQVSAIVGQANILSALSDLIASPEEEDALPPALTTEPEPSSPSGSVGSQQSSGDGSLNDSGLPDKHRPLTGLSRSDTSPTSGRTVSAA